MNFENTAEDILFLIPTCTKYSHKTKAIRGTWAKQLESYGLRYLFLIGDPNLRQPKIEGDILYVHCRDDYEFLMLVQSSISNTPVLFYIFLQ